MNSVRFLLFEIIVQSTSPCDPLSVAYSHKIANFLVLWIYLLLCIRFYHGVGLDALNWSFWCFNFP